MSTLYWKNAAEDGYWNNVLNWFEDDACTTPASDVPWTVENGYESYDLALSSTETSYSGINIDVVIGNGFAITGTCSIPSITTSGSGGTGGVIYNGTFTGDSFINSYIIYDGTFTGSNFTNNSTIYNGTFTGDYFGNSGTITDGAFTGDYCTNESLIYNGTYSGSNFTNNSTIYNGTFTGIDFSNSGTITDGAFTGDYCTNESLIYNGTYSGNYFDNFGTVSGGVYNVTNFENVAGTTCGVVVNCDTFTVSGGNVYGGVFSTNDFSIYSTSPPAVLGGIILHGTIPIELLGASGVVALTSGILEVDGTLKTCLASNDIGFVLSGSATSDAIVSGL